MKKLIINSAFANLTEATEEKLSQYESVTVNAAQVITTSESRAALMRHGVQFNSANVDDVPAGVKNIQAHNGAYTLSSGIEPTEPTVLIVNGHLEVEPGAVLDNYVIIMINGHCECPESLMPALSRARVNGSIEYYPDSALRIKGDIVVDRIFAVRAKSGLYFTRDAVLFTDCSVDLAALAEKGVSIRASKAYVAESILEQAAQIADDKTPIVSLPDGCALISGGKLDGRLLRKNGDMLYVRGNLEIDLENGALLRQLRYLKVEGTVKLPGELTALFDELNFEADQLDEIQPQKSKGKVFENKISLTVDSLMLDRCPEGVLISDCVTVKIAPELSPQQIIELVRIEDCVSIKCSPEQLSAVEQICEDCASITDGSGNDSGNLLGGIDIDGIIDDALENALGKKESDSQVVRINSASYTM